MKIPTRDLLSMAPMVLCAPLAAGQDCGPPQAITTGEDGPGPAVDTDLDGVGKASAPPAASEENGLRYGWLSFFSGEWEADYSGRGGAHWFFGGTIPIVERLFFRAKLAGTEPASFGYMLEQSVGLGYHFPCAPDSDAILFVDSVAAQWWTLADDGLIYGGMIRTRGPRFEFELGLMRNPSLELLGYDQQLFGALLFDIGPSSVAGLSFRRGGDLDFAGIELRFY